MDSSVSNCNCLADISTCLQLSFQMLSPWFFSEQEIIELHSAEWPSKNTKRKHIEPVSIWSNAQNTLNSAEHGDNNIKNWWLTRWNHDVRWKKTGETNALFREMFVIKQRSMSWVFYFWKINQFDFFFSKNENIWVIIDDFLLTFNKVNIAHRKKKNKFFFVFKTK